MCARTPATNQTSSQPATLHPDSMKLNVFKFGFTLIELLVVIAIIGLLSSVVLSSLTQARTTADIGAVKAEFAQIRTEIALLQSDGLLGTTPAFGADGNGNFGETNGAGGSPMSCFVSEGGALRAHL
jgi:prepilin-type N-terminal cleavage/methylation domain-containing protein